VGAPGSTRQGVAMKFFGGISVSKSVWNAARLVSLLPYSDCGVTSVDLAREIYGTADKLAQERIRRLVAAASRFGVKIERTRVGTRSAYSFWVAAESREVADLVSAFVILCERENDDGRGNRKVGVGKGSAHRVRHFS